MYKISRFVWNKIIMHNKKTSMIQGSVVEKLYSMLMVRHMV